MAESFYSQQLSLPLYPGLSDADQDRVIDALTAAVRGGSVRSAA